MRLLLLLTSALILFSGDARATSCMIPNGKEIIQQYDVIFKGTVSSISANSTTFKIREVYKGVLPEKVDINHSIRSMGGESRRKFENDNEYIIFTNHSEDGTYGINVCTPVYNLKQIKEYAHSSYTQTLIEIEKFQSLKHGLDKLIKQFGSDEYYKQKAALLDDYRDYQQERLIYEELLKKQYEKDMQAVIETYAQHPDSAYGVKDRYKVQKDICTGDYAAGNNAPYFLKNFPSPAPDGHYLANNDYLLRYGQVLFNLGLYKDSLRPLCLAQISRPGMDTQKINQAEVIKVQALIKLGMTKELNAKSIDLANAVLNDIDLSGLVLERSDFSQSQINKVMLNNTNLTGSNFEGAKLNNVQAEKANFSGSKFLNAQVSGKLNQANLSNVQAGNSFINADLEGAGLSNGNFQGAKINGSLKGANLKGANFEGAYVRSLSGAIVENTKLNGIQSSYGQFSGNSDYSNVDLSGFNLSKGEFFGTDFSGAKFHSTDLSGAGLIGSNFQGADFKNTNLEGADLSSSNREKTNLSGADLSTAKLAGTKFAAAVYDCKTKFPENFNPAEHMMVSSEKCKNAPQNSAKAGILDFSKETLLSPPDRHYRLMNTAQFMNFSDVDMHGVNFEGAKIGRFERVNLAGANLKNTTGSAEIFASNLDNADFSYSNLSRIRLEDGVSLKGTKFYCANMNDLFDKGGNIEQADLTAAIFSSRNVNEWKRDFDPIKHKVLFRFMQKIIDQYGAADYSGMDFSGCDVSDIDFGATNLSGAEFKGAYFYRTNFEAANLENTNFDGARVSRDATFPANFDVSKHKLVPTSILNDGESPWQASYAAGGQSDSYMRIYTPPDYKVPDFKGENLDNLSYLASWLPGSDMESASLRFTNFSASNLEEVNFKGADLTGAILYNALLDRADLTGANLEGADLRWTRLTDVKLDQAILKNALYDNTTEWPEGFDPEKAGAFLIGEKEKPDELLQFTQNDKLTDLPEQAQIHSLAVYAGKAADGGHCGHGENIQCVLNVTVTKTDAPLLLVLSAYEPSVWRVNLSPDAKIVGVIVSGLYEQSVQGILGNIKLVNYSSKKSDHALKFWAGGAEERETIRMKAVIKSLTGRKVDVFPQPDESGNFKIE